MHFGKDPSSNFSNPGNYLLFSPEKNSSCPQNPEDSHYTSDHRNSCEPFNLMDEKPPNSSIQDFNDILYPKNKPTAPTPHTSILKLDFLDELLKDDIELRNKKVSHLESLNALRVKGKMFFKEKNIQPKKNLAVKQILKKDINPFNFPKKIISVLPQLTSVQSSEQSQIPTKKNGLSPNDRKLKIEKYLEKKKRRVWEKKVNYDCRKKFAESRLRLKGRFIAKQEINNHPYSAKADEEETLTNLKTENNI